MFALTYLKAVRALAMLSAGGKVEQRTFPGVTHEFFGMGKVVSTALAAETCAAGKLRIAFEQGPG